MLRDKLRLPPEPVVTIGMYAIAFVEIFVTKTIFIAFILLVSAVRGSRIKERHADAVFAWYVGLVVLGLALLFADKQSWMTTPVLTGLLLLAVHFAFRWKRTIDSTYQHGLEHVGRENFAPYLGAGILAVIAFFAWGRYGFVVPWAMSGDSRNHVHVAREIVESGGLRIADGYPGLTNSIYSFITGWSFDLSSAARGELAIESRVYGISVLLTLVWYSWTAGAFVARLCSTQNVMLSRSATLLSTMTVLSPLLLTNTLRWGFLPVVMAATTLLMAIGILLHHADSKFACGFVLVSAPLLMALSYPPAIPISVMIIALVIVMKRPTSSTSVKGRAIDLLVVSACPLAFLALAHQMPFQGYLKEFLNYPGGMTPINEVCLIVLLGLFCVLGLVMRDTSRLVALAGVVVSLGAVATARYMRNFLDHPYYVDKLLWLAVICCCVLVIGTIGAISTSRRAVRNSALGLLAFIGLCAFLPITHGSTTRNELISIVNGWGQPNAKEAAQIYELNGIEPRSIAWRLTDDYVAAQIMNMWLLLGVSDETEVITWPYRADVFSISQICTFATRHAPITIWTKTEEMAQAATLICNDTRVKGRAIPDRTNEEGL